MRKTLLSLAVVLGLLVGSIPAGTAAAAGANNQIVWIGDYLDKAWTGVNITTVDGKKNTSKSLYKGQATSLAVSGDWIYFLKQDPDAEILIGNIVKIKKDGTQLTEITHGNKVGQFSIEGQAIYYYAYDEDYNSNLNVMKLDGTGSKQVSAKLPFWSYTLGKGYVFYVETSGDSKLHRMKLDGTGKTTISSTVVDPWEGYKLMGDVLFYSELAGGSTKWNLMDITGKNKVSGSTKAGVVPVAYVNSWFYFEEITSKNGVQTAMTLVKIKREETQKKTVAKLGLGDKYLGLLNNYFIYKTPAGKVYQIGQDGKILNR